MCYSILTSVIWKQLVDTGQMTPQVSRILQRLRLSPKKLTCHCRTMIDYIIYTCPKPGTPSNSKFVAVITHLNNLIWKYFFCPLDRLLLCIVCQSMFIIACICALLRSKLWFSMYGVFSFVIDDHVSLKGSLDFCTDLLTHLFMLRADSNKF